MPETVILPEAPNEPQIFYYCNIIKCLKYLEQNPAFEGFMYYEPVLWFTDEQLTETSHIYGDIYTGQAWAELLAKTPPGVIILPIICASDVTHVTNFSGDGKSI